MILQRFVSSLGGLFMPKITLFSNTQSISRSFKKYLKSSSPTSLLPLRLGVTSLNNEVESSNISTTDIEYFDPTYLEVGTRVVTDIDDTVKSSGGIKLFGIPLGGIDVQYERGAFYPGAFQFAFELTHASFNKRKSSTKSALVSSSPSSSSSLPISPYPPKVAVLTARAKEFKFALALKDSDKLCSAYRSIGQSHGFENWGVGQVYYGSVKEWILQKRKGIRKFKNFEIMMENDAKHNRISDYILIGDTGEKDEDAGERIARKYGPSRMKAIFLHVVSDNHNEVPTGSVVLPSDRICNRVPIYYFRTYVGAATKAFKAKLINADGVNRVISNALGELKQLDFNIHSNRVNGIDSRSRTETLIGSPPPANYAKSRWQDLHQDIREAKLAINRKFF